jgi:hypothetical protein
MASIDSRCRAAGTFCFRVRVEVRHPVRQRSDGIAVTSSNGTPSPLADETAAIAPGFRRNGPALIGESDLIGPPEECSPSPPD